MPQISVHIEKEYFAQVYAMIQGLDYGQKTDIQFPESLSLEEILAHFPADKTWTYEEVCAIFPPESRLEIIHQKIYLMPAPSIKHQDIVLELAMRMKNFVNQKDLEGKVSISPVDVKLDDENVVQPDIVYTKDTKKIKENYIKGAPNLTVEVYSKNKSHEAIKKELYAKSGVKEYWAVEPDKESVTVSVLEKNQYEVFSKAQKEGTVLSKVLNGFGLNIRRLF